MIRLERVTRHHGTGASRSIALDDVSLAFERGEFTVVAGPSGSGKTSLLNLIGAIDLPTSGQVFLNDQDLTRLSDERLAQVRLEHIGFIFQQFNLVPVLTAAENVELPLLFRGRLRAAERHRAVDEALDRVGLGDKGRRRPAELSGGEQQRVSIARALAGHPELVLADEPTANLDHETGASVIGLMQELNRELQTTFVYASHDPELITLAERVVRLRDGRLVEAA
ncbi:MAG: ABC transporter ATP-binding protein [bacterium]|nr:ABC transporter ATP-binding protein [bacterium]